MMNLPTRKYLTLEAARAAFTGCEAKARQHGWNVVIAIVDEGGHAILVQRLDGTQWSSVETALGKARAAAAFKRPTRLLEEMINSGRTGFLSVQGPFAFLQGGVPIEADGQVIGAIGVSGVKASDDEIVAIAGVAALAK